MSLQPDSISGQPYPLPPGMHVIPDHLVDSRPDFEVDDGLLHFNPVSDEKNIWFFWDTGYEQMHPCAKRTVRAWHRRFFKQGWKIRVTDRLPGSPLNIAHLLDVDDPDVFPRAFAEGTLSGTYAPQHTSDLVRWPLLLKYGGVYADVGLIQIGDLDRLWNMTVGDPTSRFQVLSYNAGSSETRFLTNYFLASGRANSFFARCHRLLLELWAAEGGKNSTDGLHSSPLLRGVPLIGAALAEDVQKSLSDYNVQGQVMSMVMGLVDEEDGWNGPEYVADHVYAIDFLVGSSLYNEMTAQNGLKQFELMSLPLPKDDEVESADQKLARGIVEACLQRSFGFKLAHGLTVKVIGDTLGSLWRKHEGSDNIRGTHAHWLRHATMYWNQDHVPPALDFKAIEPFKRGRLLKGE